MKAVVLEIKDGMAAVMKEDGTVEKVKRVCEVGDVIEISENSKVTAFSKKGKTRKFQAVAAAVIAAFVLLGGTFHYTTTVKACTFVSMDVNPSLEYVLNSRDRVLTLKAYNEDATSIVDFLNTKGKVKGKPIDEAISATTKYLKELGYLGQTEKEDNILVSVATADNAASDRVAAVVRTAIEENEEIPVRIEVKQTTLEEHKQAEEYGISTGRYVKAVEGKEREADASGKMTEESKKEAPVLTAQDVEKVMNEPVENLVSPDVPATINGTELKEASNQETTEKVTKPGETANPDKKKDNKKDDKKKKDEKKETETAEAAVTTGSAVTVEEMTTETEEQPSTETEKDSEAASNPEEKKDVEEVPSTEQTGEGETEDTEPSTEAVDPAEEQPEGTEMTDEERAAAEQEEVRKQQEIEAAEAEAEAEAVRRQQEIEAAEGVTPVVDSVPSQAVSSTVSTEAAE